MEDIAYLVATAGSKTACERTNTNNTLVRDHSTMIQSKAASFDHISNLTSKDIRETCSSHIEKDSSVRLNNDKDQMSNSRSKERKKNYKCTVCSKSFTGFLNLKFHLKIHSLDRPYTCETCDEEFLTVESFQKHNHNLKFKCSFCEKSFKKGHLLRVHMRSHSEERPFVCTVCNMSFKTKTHLKGHTRTHTGEKLFSCHICGSLFSTSSNLKQHLKLHAGTKPHKCDECDRSFSRPSDLLQHKRNHSGEKPYGCNLCGKRYMDRSGYQFHLMSHTDNKPHGCRYCGKRFIQCSDMKRHERLHTGERPHQCPMCSKGFAQLGNLKSHMFTHIERKQFQCSECEKDFSKSKLLYSHYKEVHHFGKREIQNIKAKSSQPVTKRDVEKEGTCITGFQNVKSTFQDDQNTNKSERSITEVPKGPVIKKENYKSIPLDKGDVKNKKSFQTDSQLFIELKPHKCGECSEAFETKEDMLSHIEFHVANKKKPHVCTKCGKGFMKRFALVTHMHLHTGLKPYKCVTCDKQFPNKSGLHYHAMTHTNKRPHVCDICERGFILSSHLKAHHVRHTGIKSHKCSVCSKGFTTVSNLREHQRKHTGAGSWRCKICEHTFTRKDVLLRHVKSHYGEKPYTCHICGKGYADTKGFRYHMDCHEGSKRFKCLTCPKAFIQRSDLQKHQRIHTGEKPFCCHQCGKCFSVRGNYKKHLQCHSNNTINGSSNKTRSKKAKYIDSSKNDARSHTLPNTFQDVCSGKSNRTELVVNTHNDISHGTILQNASDPVLEHSYTLEQPLNELDNACDVSNSHVIVETPTDGSFLFETMGETVIFTEMEPSNVTIEIQTEANESSLSDMMLQTATYAVGTVFRCDLCNEDFFSSTDLTQHIVRHTSEEPLILLYKDNKLQCLRGSYS